MSETATVAPTLLVRLPASETIELTPSAKAIYPFGLDDPDLLLGASLGVGIAVADGRVILRPEAGFVINPGEEGGVWGLTLGASLPA